MAAKDLTEKALEAFNDVFADIVNGLLFHGEPIVSEDALTDAQPFSIYKADGALHGQERDIAKYWNSKTDIGYMRIAFFGMENQSDYDPLMPLRGFGYDGAAYRAQLSGSEFYPVVTLVLYFGTRPWGKNRTLYDVIRVSKKMEKYVPNYKLNLFEIARLPKEAINWFHSDFRIVVDYFVNTRYDPEYRPTDPVTFKHVDELLKLMAALTNDDRFFEPLSERGEKPKDMCELLDRIEKKGFDIGREEGIDIGKLEAFADLVKDGLLSVQVASEKMNLSPDEFLQKTASLPHGK